MKYFHMSEYELFCAFWEELFFKMNSHLNGFLSILLWQLKNKEIWQKKFNLLNTTGKMFYRIKSILNEETKNFANDS